MSDVGHDLACPRGADPSASLEIKCRARRRTPLSAAQRPAPGAAPAANRRAATSRCRPPLPRAVSPVRLSSIGNPQHPNRLAVLMEPHTVVPTRRRYSDGSMPCSFLTLPAPVSAKRSTARLTRCAMPLSSAAMFSSAVSVHSTSLTPGRVCAWPRRAEYLCRRGARATRAFRQRTASPLRSPVRRRSARFAERRPPGRRWPPTTRPVPRSATPANDRSTRARASDHSSLALLSRCASRPSAHLMSQQHTVQHRRPPQFLLLAVGAQNGHKLQEKVLIWSPLGPFRKAVRRSLPA